MTETYSYALPLLSEPRAQTNPITRFRATLTIYPGPPAPVPVRAGNPTFALPDEPVTDRILIGLTLLTLPATIYGLWETCRLISSGALDHAVRAFLS